MRKLTIGTFLSLDGVMQAPGGPDEDRSGGFDKGGWLVPFADEDMGRIVDDAIAGVGGFVLGRRTYEIFAAHWPRVDRSDPVAKALNSLPKYVASTTLQRLEWENSTLIEGDIAGAVADLKQQPGGDLLIQGSGELAQTLMQHNLIDTYQLWFFPVVIGSGKRLFRSHLPRSLRLVDTITTSTGVAVHSYELGRPVTFGTFGLEQ
jgi:dihydrofolate reductase